MWNWALDSCNNKYLDSFKNIWTPEKKTYFQSDCKNGLQKQNQPCPTSRYQNIVNLHLSQNYTSLLLPVWINEHHTLGKLLLSRQNKLSTHHNSLHWHIQHIGTAQQLKIFQTCRIDNLSSWKYFPIQWYAEQSSPLTPQNIIFMIFKSQMSILCVKTRDMLAVGQGCDQKASKSWKMFSLFPLTRNSQLL